MDLISIEEIDAAERKVHSSYLVPRKAKETFSRICDAARWAHAYKAELEKPRTE